LREALELTKNTFFWKKKSTKPKGRNLMDNFWNSYL